MPASFPPVKSVAICGNRFQDEYLPRIKNLISSLSQAEIKVLIERNFFNYIIDHQGEIAQVEVVDAPLSGIDTIISIGGDGTFIRAARKAGKSGIPIAGVNTGHLGFLANFSIDNPAELTDLLLSGTAAVEKRTLLKISCEALPEDILPYALNEVALLKTETSSMINVHVNIDSLFLADYLADGLVISTPTGSTAYNLSVGGPILQPILDCMAISPVAPHSLTLRPIVVKGDSKLEMAVSSRVSDYRISIDGTSFSLPCSQKVGIEKADFHVNVIRRPSENFASTLRDKLHWASR